MTKKSDTVDSEFQGLHSGSPDGWYEESESLNDFLRNVRRILNRLVPGMSRKVAQQIKDLQIVTQDQLTGTANLIYEKATVEQNKTAPCASLCKYMFDITVPMDDMTGEFLTFRKLLITRCQNEFEKNLSAPKERNRREPNEGLEYRRKPFEEKHVAEEMGSTFGNIRFIGELFKLKLLKEVIMHSCLTKLIRSNDEDHLAKCCLLLTTIGRELDHCKAKKQMDHYFAQMQQLVDQKKTSIKFLKKVIKLRQDNWIERKAENNSTEKTHKKAQRKPHNKQLQSQQPFTKKKQNQGARVLGFHSTSERYPKDEGKSQLKFVHGNAKLSKPVQVDEKNIQLGPPRAGGGFKGSWGKGSSGGFRSSSEESDHPPPPPNRLNQRWQCQESNRYPEMTTLSTEKRFLPTDLGQKSNLFLDEKDVKPVQVDEKNIELGQLKSGGESMGAWGKESSGGEFRPSQESDHPSTTINRSHSDFHKQTQRHCQESSRYPEMTTLSPKKKLPPADMRQKLNLGVQVKEENVHSESPKADGGFTGAVDEGNSGGGLGPSAQERDHPSTPSNRSQLNVHEQNQSECQESRQIEEISISKELSPAEIELKSEVLLNEYIKAKDVKKSARRVTDLASSNAAHVFVKYALNKALRHSDKCREDIARLLHHLVKEGCLTPQHYQEGLSEVLGSAQEAATAVPCIWQYLGDIIGDMVYDKTMSLQLIRDALCYLVQCDKAGEVMAAVLHRVGNIQIEKLWRASGLKWSEVLPHTNNIQEFLSAEKLEFTRDEESVSPSANPALPMEQICVHLDRLIVERGMENEDIFDWIAANVPDSRIKEPSFIRALMNSVCSSAIKSSGGGSNCKLDEAQMQKRSVLLQKYFDHKAELELQALYALQAVVHKLEHPPGLLRQIFDTLYDEDVISEDAFNQWETSQDPAEQAGKVLAKKSVVQFFTWLREEDDC